MAEERTDSLEREIEETRERLASTIDLLVDPAAGAHQPGEQGLAHDSRAEDGGLLHAAHFRHFFEMRDRRKNDRFCGRSASRRIR